MSFKKSLKELLEKIENIGQAKLEKARWPNVELRHIQITNFIAIVSAGISLFQCAIELIEGKWFYAVSDFIGGGILLLTLSLSAMGKFNLARVFLLVALNLNIYYFNMISDFSANLELLYFLFLLMPFFIYSTREVASLALACLLPFVLYCLNRFYSEFNPVPPQYIIHAPDWYGIAAPIVTFVVAFLVIFRFLKISEQLQITLIHHSKFSSLGEMASGISHEINNPLSVVILNAQILSQTLRKNENVGPEIIDKLMRVETAGKRAAKIVNSLMQFAKDSKSEPFVPFLLRSCIQNTLELCLQKFESRHVRCELIMSIDPIIRGDSSQISQVIINLLNNAFDAVKASQEKWIQLDVTENDRWVFLRVKDSGPGIESKNIEKIMEPFFTTKPVDQGVGLGLSISKGIVESHGGKLTLERQQAHTTFLVQLPRVLN